MNVTKLDRCLFGLIALLLVGYVSVDTYSQRYQLDRILEADACVQSIEAAQAYATPLASEMTRLAQRLDTSQAITSGLNEANFRLDSSLKQAVEHLQTQLNESDALVRKIDLLEWKISVLETALEAIKNGDNE